MRCPRSLAAMMLTSFLLTGGAFAQDDNLLPPDPTEPESEALPSAEPSTPLDDKEGEPSLQVRVSQILTHPDMHRWERHVRGFRREHNFALSAGVTSGTWTVRWADEEASRKFDNSGLYSRFQYSFHIQLYKGLGYVLGSGAGYHYETADRRRDFRPVAAWQYPGLLLGLALNVSPVVRFSTAFEAYLERHNGIEENSVGGGEPTAIHVTMQAYDAGVYTDVFYDLSWALRMEAHLRHLEYLPPGERDGFPVDVRLHKDDRWLGVGLLYHLL
jgi:hypothetical protein